MTLKPVIKCFWCGTEGNLFCDSDCAANSWIMLKYMDDLRFYLSEKDRKILFLLNKIKPKQSFKRGD